LIIDTAALHRRLRYYDVTEGMLLQHMNAHKILHSAKLKLFQYIVTKNKTICITTKNVKLFLWGSFSQVKTTALGLHWQKQTHNRCKFWNELWNTFWVRLFMRY